MFAIFPIAQAVMSMWILDPPDADSAYIARIGTILFCIASDVSLYLAVRGMSQRAELKLSNEMLSEQIENEKRTMPRWSINTKRRAPSGTTLPTICIPFRRCFQAAILSRPQKYAAEIIPRHTFSSTLGQCENRIVDAFHGVPP